MSTPGNEKFDIRGLNHLALVCRDMKRTVEFYSGVLGMPLIKTIDLPHGGGQHFFFDIGNGDSLAFFWFPDAPDGREGLTHPANIVGGGSITSAHSSMNHVAFNVPPGKVGEYRDKLEAAGVECTPVIHHDDTDAQVSDEENETTFVSSVYFRDPDGFLLEFAAWTRELNEADVSHEPATAEDRDRYLALRKKAPSAAE